MTKLETEIYKKDEENVIGAKVIVSADNGQTIDNIKIINETEFQELKKKLNVLGDTYVQFEEESNLSGNTLDDILKNEEENAVINATYLNGYQSSYYAKSNHIHTKENITNLYDYDISLPKYNLKIGESIPVTVRVTDMSGTPVKNMNIAIERDDAPWVNGHTNNNGEFSSSFTATSFGLVTFAVNSQKVQCFVEKPVDDTGWVDIPFVSSEFSNYSPTGNTLQCRRIGDIVHIKGIVTNTITLYNCKTQDKVIARLPNGFHPSREEYKRNQASGTASFLIRVGSDGKITMVANRYGTDSSENTIDRGRWLHMHMTYFVG